MIQLSKKLLVIVLFNKFQGFILYSIINLLYKRKF